MLWQNKAIALLTATFLASATVAPSIGARIHARPTYGESNGNFITSHRLSLGCFSGGTDWNNDATWAALGQGASCANWSTFDNQYFDGGLSDPTGGATFGILPPDTHLVQFTHSEIYYGASYSYWSGFVEGGAIHLDPNADFVQIVGFWGYCSDEITDPSACAADAWENSNIHKEPALCVPNPEVSGADDTGEGLLSGESFTTNPYGDGPPSRRVPGAVLARRGVNRHFAALRGDSLAPPSRSR